MPLVLPLRAVQPLERFRQVRPIVSEVLPFRFVEGVSGVIRIEAAQLRSLAAFLPFAHRHSFKKAVQDRAN